MKTKFAVGDKVIITNKASISYRGKKAEVTQISTGGCWVKIEGTLGTKWADDNAGTIRHSNKLEEVLS